MIDRKHDLAITKQAEVLKISRGSVYYLPRPVSSADIEIMRQLDRLHLEYPFAGSRMLRGLLALQGCIQFQRQHQSSIPPTSTLIYIEPGNDYSFLLSVVFITYITYWLNFNK